MKLMKAGRKFLLSLILVFGLSAVMVPLSLDQMTKKADLIALGHCIDKKVYQKGKMIWTEYTIRIYEVLKGAKVKEVVVRQPGGEVGDRGIKISGTVSFFPLEETLLFLKKRQNVFEPLGWVQGKFKIYYDPLSKKKYAYRQFGDVLFLEKGKTIRKPAPQKIELDVLKAQIRNILSKQIKEK